MLGPQKASKLARHLPSEETVPERTRQARAICSFGQLGLRHKGKCKANAVSLSHFKIVTLERGTKKRPECARQTTEAPLSKTENRHSVARALASAEAGPYRLSSFARQMPREADSE
ncbi:unnamed protein product [Arctia plantaginis]|uniref:Uncharacterized protein n=1 Tax=Arctia plantaginis TaxID=874455 RepID=A0A8S1B1E4_ARCPL|nr:unnamed protein product [Arctia plantaginis]